MKSTFVVYHAGNEKLGKTKKKFLGEYCSKKYIKVYNIKCSTEFLQCNA